MRYLSCLVKAIALSCGLLLCQCSAPSAPTNTASIPCSELQQDAFHHLLFGVQDPDDILQWIGETYHISPQAVTRNSYSDGQRSLSWSVAGTRYLVWFRQEKLASVETRWQSAYPTIGDALRCLDEPEMYHAEYRQLPEARELDFGVWYPAQGTSVFASQISHEPQPPVITRETKLTSMTITAPGPTKDVVTSAYALGYASGVRDSVLQTLKPWPGSLEAIEVHVAQ